MRSKKSTSRGVTLIEVMITVAIIGVLATVAVVAYRSKVTSAKVTEATQMIQNIRAAQDNYKAETGSYADVSTSITSFYPAATPGTFTTAWGALCGSACKTGMDWSVLSVQPTGPLQFGYATVAGSASQTTSSKGVAFSVNGTAVSFTPLEGKAWYVVTARGDTNGNGVFVQLISTSASNDVWIDKEGE